MEHLYGGRAELLWIPVAVGARRLEPRSASLSEVVAEIEIASRPFVARSRLVATYVLPATALIFLIRPFSASGGHLLSGTCALASLTALFSLVLLRVLALPEFTHLWKLLALIALGFLPR